jgi:cell wall assembly regulator SMI1
MTIDDVIARLDKVAGVEHGSGIGPDEIGRAEEALALRFPRSYRTYLSKVGWLHLPGDWFYGLGTGVPAYAELVGMTMSERHEVEPALPAHLLPLRNDGGGNHYCLDLARATADDGPVVFWDHAAGENQTPEDWSPTFTAWLDEQISMAEGD